ncbi:MAG TPA: DUF4112 domain-containing protein [Pyrinomonadaceae bacterium]|nr:DUF4112 domain-containing protein [Pyrinomonadaceae bacterium]
MRIDPANELARQEPLIQKGEGQTSIERLAWLMDDLFRIPVLGWRFGLDAIIGLIPGVGDTASSLASFYILASAVRYRVPRITLLRMGLNIGLDYLVGSLPFVGDLFDAWWKSNQRNIALLRERARLSSDTEEQGSVGDWIFVAGILVSLVVLAIGAAFLSFYLLLWIANQIAQLS